MGIAIYNLITGYVSNALWGLVGEEVSRIYREKFFFSLLRQEVAYFDSATTGSLTSMLNTNVEHLRSGLVSALWVSLEIVILKNA